jgi:hypothetical protein
LGVGFLQSEALPVSASNNMRAAASIDIAMEDLHAISNRVHGEELHVHGTGDLHEEMIVSRVDEIKATSSIKDSIPLYVPKPNEEKLFKLMKEIICMKIKCMMDGIYTSKCMECTSTSYPTIESIPGKQITGEIIAAIEKTLNMRLDLKQKKFAWSEIKNLYEDGIYQCNLRLREIMYEKISA